MAEQIIFKAVDQRGILSEQRIADKIERLRTVEIFARNREVPEQKAGQRVFGQSALPVDETGNPVCGKHALYHLPVPCGIARRDRKIAEARAPFHLPLDDLRRMLRLFLGSRRLVAEHGVRPRALSAENGREIQGCGQPRRRRVQSGGRRHRRRLRARFPRERFKMPRGFVGIDGIVFSPHQKRRRALRPADERGYDPALLRGPGGITDEHDVRLLQPLVPLDQGNQLGEIAVLIGKPVLCQPLLIGAVDGENVFQLVFQNPPAPFGCLLQIVRRHQRALQLRDQLVERGRQMNGLAAEAGQLEAVDEFSDQHDGSLLGQPRRFPPALGQIFAERVHVRGERAAQPFAELAFQPQRDLFLRKDERTGVERGGKPRRIFGCGSRAFGIGAADRQ